MNFEEFLLKYKKKKVVSFTKAQVKKPLVSVCVQTYQHQDYILECLNGIINQKVDFEYEILIGEDCSSDGTLKLCKEFAIKHKKIVTLFTHDRINNISINGALSGRFNMLYNLFSARGKYIALCEGDDYWTDPLKLQKQVDFLEVNEDYGICFHNVNEISSFMVGQDKIIPNVKKDFIFNLTDYILSNKTATCSILLKSECIINLPNWFSKLPFGDLGIILWVMYNSNEKGMVLKDVMGVYRIHNGGVHGKFLKNNKSLINAYEQHISFTKIIKKELLNDSTYKLIIFKKFKITYKRLYDLNRKTGNTFKSFLMLLHYFYYNIRLKNFLS